MKDDVAAVESTESEDRASKDSVTGVRKTERPHDPDSPTEEIELESVDLSIASLPVAKPAEEPRKKSSQPPPLPAEALRLRRPSPIPPAADLKARLKAPTPLPHRSTPPPLPAVGDPARRALRPAAPSGEHSPIETLQVELEKLTKRMRERDAYLGELEAVYAQRADVLLALENQIETQKAELAARDARIAQLEAALAARIAMAKPAPAPDDLTRIKGIGPRYAQMLHELGVRSFAAIAAWTQDDCAHFARQLKVKQGRVERDRWVEQARALCEPGAIATNEPDL
jgi:predicted flap endonuclease-1-like 5' DNA nuclease